jgi:adenylyltransferase/sulfurtransferase
MVHNVRLSRENALDILGDYDIIADGTDNFETRYLVNDACVLLGKPNVYGSIYQFEGQSSVFHAGKGPCYRCLFPTPPPPGLVPSCGESGVLGVLPGIIGTIQACEVLKLIIGGEAGSLIGRLLILDAWNMKFRELKIAADPNCPICGQNPTIRELVDYERFCGIKTDSDDEPIETITAIELKERIDRGDNLQLIDIREPHERSIFKFPGAKYIPLGQMARRAGEFDPASDTVFLCKIGQRSIFAIRALRDAGYKGRMFNLKDGVNAWARDVDKSLPQY